MNVLNIRWPGPLAPESVNIKDGIFGRDTSLSQMPAGAILDMKKLIGSVVVRELQVLRVPF